MHNDHPHNAAPSSAPADRRALLAGLGGLAAGAFLAGTRSAHAGPLDPPAGPITSTGLTLEELAARTSRPNGIAEPRRPLPDPITSFQITQPGSYYLTSDTNSGIGIFASDVTLDLCGFTVNGGFSLGVIEIEQGCERVLIRNGRVNGRFVPNSRGVSCEVNAQVTLEDLDIVGNAPSGITGGVFILNGSAACRRVSVAGFRSGIIIPTGVIEDCQTDVPGGIEISTGPGVVRRCTVRTLGTFSGIRVQANSAVIDCQVINTGTAASISVGNGSIVDQCVVNGGSPGISAGDSCAVLRCVVRDARVSGIRVGGFTRVADCTVSGTISDGANLGVGIRGTQRLRVERSTIAFCNAQGVRCTSFDAAISDCSIVGNGGVGIECVGPAMIDRCHLANNNGGMFFDALTRVSQCHLDFNGPYGIWATSTSVGGTFISDCDITRHTNGVDIRSSSGSGVFRCHFAGNTTSIVAPVGNFQLLVTGAAAANAATNPNINIAL